MEFTPVLEESKSFLVVVLDHEGSLLDAVFVGFFGGGGGGWRYV